MGKVIFTDIKRKDRSAEVRLKVASASSNHKSRKAIDLSACNGKKQIVFAKKDQSISDIRSGKKIEKSFFIPENRAENKKLLKLLPIFQFSAVALIVVFMINLINVYHGGVGLSNNLSASASDAYESMLNGANSAKANDFGKAQNNFSQAEKDFNASLNKLSLLKTVDFTSSVGNNPLNAANQLLEAGKAIAHAGSLFTGSIDNLKDFPAMIVENNRKALLSSEEVSKRPSITEKVSSELNNLDLIITDLDNAQNNLSKIDSGLIPEKYRTDYENLKISLEKLLVFLKLQRQNIPAVLKLLGDRYPHRYLVLLQNDSEKRPTGGFIGSFLIVDMNDGYITNTEFHDVYDYDGQLRESIDAPEEIAEITDSWGLRDSSYSPDFAISAEQAAWFLQKSKIGPSVDSVIAINLSVIEDLLPIIGDLHVASLKGPLNKDNFDFVISYLVESKFYGEQTPKKILGSVIEEFKKNLSKTEDYQNLLSALRSAIKQRKIIFYSRDQEVQEFFDRNNLTMHQQETAFDYLQILAISVGGNKTDKYIRQQIDHNTIIEQDGSVIDEVTITRTHVWSQTELSNWQKMIEEFDLSPLSEAMKDLLGRGVNKSNLKIYVPLGSELENSVGVAIDNIKIRHDDLLKKTYFLLPFQLGPGETVSVILRYRLPFKMTMLPADIYRINVEGQAADANTSFVKRLSLTPGLSILREFPSTLPKEGTNLIEGFEYGAVIAN